MANLFTMDRSDMSKWPLLEAINVGTRTQFILIKIHHDRGFGITFDDRVLAFGDNSTGLLGLGHQDPVEQTKEVLTLRHKRLIEISCSFGVNLALSEIGQVYHWGNFSDKTVISKPKLIIDEGVISVNCTCNWMVALTNKGEVLTWTGSSNPTKLNIPAFIVHIASGIYHSVALDNNGRIHAWGSNCYRQLGILDRNTSFRQPCEVNTYEPIKSITCGALHTLFLTINNLLFISGRGRSLQMSATPFNFGKDFVLDQVLFISYQFYSKLEKENLLICTSNGGEIIVWPEEEQKSATLYSNSCRTIIDVICEHSKYKVVPGMIKINIGSFTKPSFVSIKNNETPAKFQVKGNLNLVYRISTLFDDSSTADIVFIFDQGRTISAHRVILAVSSDYFKTKLQTNWKDMNRIVIADYSYAIYYHYIRFLYTSDLSTTSLKTQVELYRFAIMNGEENLLECCMSIFIENLTSQNCCQAFELAGEQALDLLQSKVSEFMVKQFE